MSPRCLALLVLVLAWLWPGEAGAHGLRPGVLSLHEDQPGSFTVMWTEPVDTSGGPQRAKILPGNAIVYGSRLIFHPSVAPDEHWTIHGQLSARGFLVLDK